MAKWLDKTSAEIWQQLREATADPDMTCQRRMAVAFLFINDVGLEAREMPERLESCVDGVLRAAIAHVDLEDNAYIELCQGLCGYTKSPRKLGYRLPSAYELEKLIDFPY